MTYEAVIETPLGLRRISCTDEQIDNLAALSCARILRDDVRCGVMAITSEMIAKQYIQEAE